MEKEKGEKRKEKDDEVKSESKPTKSKKQKEDKIKLKTEDEGKKKKQKVEDESNKQKIWITTHDTVKDPRVLDLPDVENSLEDQDSHICILDKAGYIIFINKAWKKFSVDNGGNIEHFYKGWKYLDVMYKIHEPVLVTANISALDTTDQFASGIRRLLEGHTTEEYHLEYPCDSPTIKRVFLASAHALNVSGKQFTIISHKKLSEEY